MKQFLKNNKYTKNIYAFLFYWKYEGIKNAFQKTYFKLSPSNTHSSPTVTNDFKRSYMIPEILRESEEEKKVEIVSCAFRKHEPHKGLTGGPNGVLATERSIFGDIYHGMRMRYIFWSKNVTYPKHLEAALKNVSFMVKTNFYAAYYLEYCTNIWERLDKKTNFLFVCHDVGFAYGAYLRNCPYVLVYHTQGSMINERESFGEVFSERDKELANKIEAIVFQNAEKVYFPSKGAKASFLATTEIDTSNVNFAEKPLYNTIEDKPKNLDIDGVIERLRLQKVDHNEVDVFLSVGDFSENKGMERVPVILQEYVNKTHRKVYWIGIGSKHKAGIYDELLNEQANWNFESSLFGERVDHNTLLALMEVTDFYIMLQRHSIFDLSTLEAMRAGKALVLSSVGGNLEVNLRDNVILVDMSAPAEAIERLAKANKYDLGLLNKEVFEQYFSKERFFEAYSEMIDEGLQRLGIKYHVPSLINNTNLSLWKGKYQGRTAVICGSGSSLDQCIYDNKNIYIALNKALFFKEIKFDFLFMQDTPKNQPYTMSDYNKYPCTKFYAIITNIITKKMGFSCFDEEGEINGEVVQYELAPTWFDYRVDRLDFDIDHYCFVDAQSVLFSAIQFAVFAGFQEIVLYGIEFSDTNYGNSTNPNKYAPAVINNLLRFKREIAKKFPETIFRFGASSNQELIDSFAEIDQIIREQK